ncbi:S-layer homology domain-containing protein, partial [Vallitalea sediminicola]
MPNKNITRAEVITVLGRILEMTATVLPPSNDFTDKAKIPTWADEYVDLLQYSGLLTGYSDGTVRIYKNIAISSLAMFLY